MRTGVAARATELAPADRDTSAGLVAAMRARVVSCLLGLLLVLQLAGPPHPGPHLAVADPETIALAGLSAAIGQPVTLCDHGGGPVRPGDPADSCEHCIFCHSVAIGFAAAPVVAPGVARVAIATDIERPRADVALVRARRRGGAIPRGPPLFG